VLRNARARDVVAEADRDIDLDPPGIRAVQDALDIDEQADACVERAHMVVLRTRVLTVVALRPEAGPAVGPAEEVALLELEEDSRHPGESQGAGIPVRVAEPDVEVAADAPVVRPEQVLQQAGEGSAAPEVHAQPGPVQRGEGIAAHAAQEVQPHPREREAPLPVDVPHLRLQAPEPERDARV
jgi:hypothetical protein